MYKQEGFPSSYYIGAWRSTAIQLNNARYAPIYRHVVSNGATLFFLYPGNARACPGINTPMHNYILFVQILLIIDS